MTGIVISLFDIAAVFAANITNKDLSKGLGRVASSVA